MDQHENVGCSLQSIKGDWEALRGKEMNRVWKLSKEISSLAEKL